MRALLAALSLMVVSVSAEQVIDTDLMARALGGDKTARLTIAKAFNDPRHSMYYPKKAVEMYVKLAREGEQDAFEPLANAFANPSSEFYDPGRAITYLKRLPGVPAGQLLLYEALSYRVPISRVDEELVVRGVGSDDPYFALLGALSHFPFDSALPAQRSALIDAVAKSVAEPYLAYIYPALVLPVAGNTHLLAVAKAALEGTKLPELTWYQDAMTQRWFPVTDSQGVKWVKFSVEPDDWRGQRLVGMVIAYPAEALPALQDYYAGMMESFEDGLRLPGVFLRLRAAGDITLAEFVFTAVQPLLKPSRLPDELAKRKAIPRMLFSSTIRIPGE